MTSAATVDTEIGQPIACPRIPCLKYGAMSKYGYAVPGHAT